MRARPPMLAPLRGAWSDRSFRRSALLTVAGLAVTLTLFRQVLGYVEARPGVRLSDPLLAAFAPVDVSWYLVALTYGAFVLALIHLLDRPCCLLMTLQAYTLLLIARAATLFLMPLEGPSTMIDLRDPVIELYVQRPQPLTKDLFFSGHTSAAFLFFLAARSGWPKAVFLAATLLIGALLLLQHVHYTIDVLAAPWFALGSYQMIFWCRRGRHPRAAQGREP